MIGLRCWSAVCRKARAQLRCAPRPRTCCFLPGEIVHLHACVSPLTSASRSSPSRSLTRRHSDVSSLEQVTMSSAMRAYATISSVARPNRIRCEQVPAPFSMRRTSNAGSWQPQKATSTNYLAKLAQTSGRPRSGAYGDTCLHKTCPCCCLP